MDCQNETKRTDVGYKRPPVEHQFKPGQKPPPRKKARTNPESRTELLFRILQEQQRVQIGTDVRWCTKAQLVLLVAFQLAEKGSATVSRALAECLMAGEEPISESETLIHVSPREGPSFTYTSSGKKVDLDFGKIDW